MMQFVHYSEPARLPRAVRDPVDAFLARYINDGTVALPPSQYHAADRWTVGYGDGGSVQALAAHRRFVDDDARAAIIQIQGTFLDPAVRNRGYAAMLLQGQTFADTWREDPLRQIFVCTRTRVPAAYKAVARHNAVYPRIGNLADNQINYDLARRIARRVYGDHVELECPTYVLRNSYGPDAELTPIAGRNCEVSQYFHKHLDYAKDEAIFILSHVRPQVILAFVATRAAQLALGWRAVRAARQSLTRRAAMAARRRRKR